jgi:hypothetical protein
MSSAIRISASCGSAAGAKDFRARRSEAFGYGAAQSAPTSIPLVWRDSNAELKFRQSSASALCDVFALGWRRALRRPQRGHWLPDVDLPIRMRRVVLLVLAQHGHFGSLPSAFAQRHRCEFGRHRWSSFSTIPATCSGPSESPSR